MTLLPGQSLAHYRLLEKIGEGGMGVVWKAVDTSLDREVAIKVLPPAFSADKDRLARFEREAKLLASLNHPSIAGVFGLHEASGTRFLAMELVGGEDLLARIRRGPIAIEEALPIALEVAQALEAAHESAVIHRDLKPANIRVTPDGQVKVLDFGLAKVMIPDSSSSGSESSRSPTMTSAGTVAGVIMGTAAYMSPEQAKGKPVDRRADIWSFGVVLLEMLTGKQPFRGESISETIAAVIMKEPDLHALPATTPPRMRRLIERCLRKDPKARLRDIGEARVEIQETLAGGSAADSSATGATAGAPAVRRSRTVLWIAAGVAAGALLGFFVRDRIAARASRSPARPVEIEMALPGDAPIAAGSFLTPMALSPDGSHLTYVGVREGVRRLYVRDMSRFGAKALAGTEGAEGPFFSPDGQWVAFFADSKLKKVSVLGGALPQILCDILDFRGGTWLPDGTIVMAPSQNSALVRMPDSGGAQEPLTTLDNAAGEFSHRFPQVLPDGKTVLFTAAAGGFDYNNAVTYAVSLETKKLTKIIQASADVQYLPSGHLAFVQAGSLLAVPFNRSTLKTEGAPRIVIEGVAVQTNTGAAPFCVSANGTLIYVPGEPIGDDVRLSWVDRSGGAQEFAVAQNAFRFPRVSPDGRKWTVMGIGNNRSGTWIGQTDDPELKRLSEFQLAPIWAPDSRRLLINTTRTGSGSTRLVWKSADGSGAEELFAESDTVWIPNSISPDGKWLAYTVEDPNTHADIWVMSTGKAAEPRAFIRTTAREAGARFSPDGKYLVYASDETGRFEINVAEFPGPGGRWQISSDGGREPVWGAGSGEIFYRSGENLVSVPVQTEPVFRAGKPLVLFHGGYEGLLGNLGAPDFDVTADGKRFLMIRSPELNLKLTQIRVVLDWFEELKTAAR